jgi:replication factor C small subunit
MKHQEVVKASGQLASNISSLWVEKYRPGTLDDIILSPGNKDIFSAYKDSETIPNLLFCGNAGIGKTSLAKIIVKDVLSCQYLYINASDESGIDTIRTKVTNFSRVMSLDGKIKIIILDECDGLTQDAQRALRNVMEEYSDHTRFILTANYKHRVIPALQSRCQSFDLTPPLDSYIDRVENIAAEEGIDIPDPGAFKVITKAYYPDLRKAINELQKNTATGEFLSEKRDSKFAETLVKIIKTGIVSKARRSIIENEDQFSGDYANLMRDIFNEVESSSDISPDKKREALVTIAEYMYRSAFVLDQEINCYACLLVLSKQL